MKKTFVLFACAAVLLSGCTTNTGTGAFLGGAAGAILGSAIGGVAAGPYGRDLGTAIGMAGGAAVGAAIGASQDATDAKNSQQTTTTTTTSPRPSSYSGYDYTGSGDDTLYDFNGNEYTGSYTATNAQHVENIEPYASISADELENPSIPLEILNARFVDNNQDYRLNSDELCKVIFEIHNNSNVTLYDLQPMVVETTGMKNIYISNSIHVEEIQPGQALRYTAMVKSGKLKAGVANFRIYAVQGNGKIVSKVSAFNVTTAK